MSRHNETAPLNIPGASQCLAEPEESVDGASHLVLSKSQENTPENVGSPLETTVTHTEDSFKRLILDQEIVVHLTPILLLINGLPQSGKSKAISQLLKALSITVSSQSNDQPPQHGLSFYELAAVEVHEHTHLSKLNYIETHSHDCYLYALKSALSRQNNLLNLPTKNIIYCNQYSNKFQSRVLNDHLSETFKQLQADTEMSLNWKTCISNGIALINIWDINHGFTIYHFLPALSGLLYNSYSWLFFNLERDGPNLDKLPPKTQPQLMKWRSRINYLLRAAKLNESPLDKRQKVCSIFATRDEKSNSPSTIIDDELRSKLANTALKLGVDDLADTHNITIINPEDESDCVKILKIQTADKLVFKQLVATRKSVPLSFIFLRSLYYKNDNVLYVKKKDMQMLADELKISSEKFQEFCELFTSLGSIIDVSLIDENSHYIILKPNLFLKNVDMIFHTKSQLTEAGIFTSSLAKSLFGNDNNDETEAYTDILVSIDLAVSLTPNQIFKSDNSLPIPSNDKIWYLPDIRTTPPLTDTTVPAKNATWPLRMLRSLDAPQSHLQVLFVKKFLKSNSDSKLCVGNCISNVTTIQAQSIGSTCIEFDIVYFGYTLEFRVSKVDKNIYTQIIRTCHDIMNEKKHAKTKYNFAVMCSRDSPKPDMPDLYELKLKRDRHILPNSELCEYCCQEERHQEKHLQMWNEVIKELSVPSDRELNGNSILLENAELVAQKMQPSYLTKRTIELFFEKLQLRELKSPDDFPNLKDWQIPMMKLIQWENQLTGNDAANPKKALAKKIMDVVNDRDTPIKDQKILQEMIVQLIDSEEVRLHHPD